MFHTLKRILQDRLRQQGVAPAVEAAQVVAAFQQVLAEKYGPESVNDLRKLSLSAGDTLEVSVKSGAFASNLKMQEKELVQALKQRCGGKAIRLRIFG